jgi:hypothetical protein
MSISSKLSQHQQHRIQQYAQKSDASHFLSQLTCPELSSFISSRLPKHRERLYPPTETLSLFLAQALNTDRSCQKAVNDAVVSRIIRPLQYPSSCNRLNN